MLKKFFTLVLFSNLFFASLAQNAYATDYYDSKNGQLRITAVIVGDTIYHDVLITIGPILKIGGSDQIANYPNKNSSTYDTYDIHTNQLLIPNVLVDKTVYYDVVINVGSILAVGYATNICDYVKPAQVTYPSEYNGVFSLPISKNKFPSTVTRSMAFLDATALADNLWPPSNGLCKNQVLFARSLWKESLSRLHQNGANRLVIHGWAGFDDLKASTWRLNKETYIPSVDADLKYVVDEAKSRNMQVYYSQQFDYTDLKGNSLDPNTITLEELRKTLDAYHIFIVEQAKYLQKIGVAGMQVDWGYPIITRMLANLPNYDPASREVWLNKMSLIIDDIRNVYSGKLIFNLIEISIDSRIASKVDAIGVTPHFGPLLISNEENKNLTVELLKLKYKSLIQQIYQDISTQTNNKNINTPIIWNVQVQSKFDHYVSGWTESVFCVKSKSGQCEQQSYKTDFSVQAIGTEAIFQAINEQTFFKTEAVNIDTGYWLNDDMTPPSSGQGPFPNLHQSVRNKPAEDIVKYWFGK